MIPCPHCDYEADSRTDQVDHVHAEHETVLELAYFGGPA